jgi:hypothetical protein
MAKLSKYFSWEEVSQSYTASRRGINNNPPHEISDAIVHTANKMDEVREILGSAILVTSWYRSPEVNALVGGSKNSAHMAGLAVDFISPRYGTPYQVCKALLKKKLALNWDQLILEHTWIHIAFTHPTIPNVKARNQVLSLLDNASYTTGLTDKKGIPF